MREVTFIIRCDHTCGVTHVDIFLRCGGITLARVDDARCHDIILFGLWGLETFHDPSQRCNSHDGINVII